MHGVLASTVASTGEVGGANRSIVTGRQALCRIGEVAADELPSRERKHRTKVP